MLGIGPEVPTPEDVAVARRRSRNRVRTVLAALESRQAEMLVFRSDGLSYQELAGAMELNPHSVGTLLSRAQSAFRKEYMKRYGTE